MSLMLLYADYVLKLMTISVQNLFILYVVWVISWMCTHENAFGHTSRHRFWPHFLYRFSKHRWIVSYHNMQQIVQQQQDEALALRISRIEIFLADQQSFQVLIEHPELYENMLGQEDNLLILKNAQNTLIDINPLNITIPLLDYHTKLNYQNNKN